MIMLQLAINFQLYWKFVTTKDYNFHYIDSPLYILSGLQIVQYGVED